MRRLKKNRASFGLALALLCVIGLAGSPSRLGAQTGPGTSTMEDSIALLQKTINARLADRDQLHRMLAALNVIDSVYRPLYPAWLVLDNDLRERVNKALRQRHPGTASDTDVIVIANPARGQILGVSAGSTYLGRIETPQTLSDSLDRELLHGTYQRTDVDLTVEPPRTSNLNPEPQYASLIASAFGIRLMFSRGLGIEAAIGREELGYHFWSSGDFSVRAIIHGLKLGILLPFPYGYKTVKPSDPLAIKPSLLVGSTGFSGEFEYPLNESKVGARLAVGDLYLGTLETKVPPGLTAYSLHSSGQLYFAHQLQWGVDQLVLTGGIGAHQVMMNRADSGKATVNVIERSDFASPLLRVDYARLGDRLYGVSVQYYNALLSLSGWVEVVRNFLFVDVKYYTPVFRDPQPWEHKYFFMISPRLQITY
jgi:hypothetical protein